MAFVKLQFEPGFYTDSTDYSAAGRWTDGNLMRFSEGKPEAIKGWQKITSMPFKGTCREMRWWSGLTGQVYVSVGTHLKLYAFTGQFLDITPIRSTGTLLSSPFATDTTTNSGGLTTITVTHASHGAIANDFVTFTGAVAVGGVLATALNAEHQITEVTNANTYKIRVSGTASSSTSGGGTPAFSYQINTGLNSTFFGTGWGAGVWGRGTWGSDASTAAEGAKLRLWSTSPYGEDLLACTRDGPIYYWDSSAGQAAALLSSLSGASDVPTVTKEITTSAERHVICFGCNPYGSATQDPMLIRWSNVEDATMWTPLSTNAAGDLRIPSGSKFITQIQTYQEILVWSDTSLHSLRYVGAPFYYGIDVISSKVSIIAPKAKAIAQDTVYWMGNGQFYAYRGSIQIIPCQVLDHVFNDINESQKDKVYCGTNTSWNEVTWFYPSANSSEVDRYVTYNYEDKIWYYGTLARTAWLDRQDIAYPIATDPNSYIYYHEIGTDDGSTSPATPIQAYIESSFVEIAEGDNYMFVDKFIPDVTFFNSSQLTVGCSINVSFTMADWPGASNSTDGTTGGNITRSSSYNATVETYTNYLNLRMRGRMAKVRYSGGQLGMAWRVGTPRINVRKDGRQ